LPSTAHFTWWASFQAGQRHFSQTVCKEEELTVSVVGHELLCSGPSEVMRGLGVAQALHTSNDSAYLPVVLGSKTSFEAS
jgi:hypothetical protein